MKKSIDHIYEKCTYITLNGTHDDVIRILIYVSDANV